VSDDFNVRVNKKKCKRFKKLVDCFCLGFGTTGNQSMRSPLNTKTCTTFERLITEKTKPEEQKKEQNETSKEQQTVFESLFFFSFSYR